MGAQNGKAFSQTLNRPHTSCSLCGAASTYKSPQHTGSNLVFEECNRCHCLCCAECYVLRRYGSRWSVDDEENAVPEYALVCRRCIAKPNLVVSAPWCAWKRIFEYCDATVKHHLLQLCHATQMGVLLPYPYTRYGWSTFFEGKRFISKGANGEAYQTTVHRDITKRVTGPLLDVLDTNMLASLAGRKVAVKAIRKSTVFSLRRWTHIQREVHALHKCRHRHVVQLHFVVQGPSEVYIVLQYVAGGDLFDWLVHQQIPIEDDVLVIARQLFQTLHYLHEVCGVVHRDIKPENILLESQENIDAQRVLGGSHSEGDECSEGNDNACDSLYIRLADFGYAKILSQSEAGVESSLAEQFSCHLPLWLPSDTVSAVSPKRGNQHYAESLANARRPFLISSTPCGTLGFAAPEILSAYNAQKSVSQRIRSNRQSTEKLEDTVKPRTPVDLVKRMDIFAAGVTVCILLTGCEPFPCLSSKEHIEAVQEGVDFSGPQWAYVSRAAKNLLRRMLSPKAADRPSALECLNSSWIKNQDPYADAATGAGDDDGTLLRKGLNRSVSMWQLLSTSFKNSVHSLRKNEGWLFVQDAQGLVKAIPRGLVNGKEDGESFSEIVHSSNGREQTSAVY